MSRWRKIWEKVKFKGQKRKLPRREKRKRKRKNKKDSIGTVRMKLIKVCLVWLKNLYQRMSADKRNLVRTKMSSNKVKTIKTKWSKRRPNKKSNQQRNHNLNQVIWWQDWRKRWARLLTSTWQPNLFKSKWHWWRFSRRRRNLKGKKYMM